MLDYHVHVLSHGEYQYTRGWIQKHLDKAKKRNLEEIGLCEHGEFAGSIDWALIKEFRQHVGIPIKIGLEIDFIPGREEETERLIRSGYYDYIIGSVHFVEGWGFDHPDYKQVYDEWDLDLLYERYFQLLQDAVKTGYFDILGHIDLIKIWGHRPLKHNILDFALPLLKVIKDHNIVVEINSSGLRKPIQEIYPSGDIVQAMFQLDIPVTVGSDAHHPEQVGEGLEAVYQLLKKTGYKKITSFTLRKPYIRSISS